MKRTKLYIMLAVITVAVLILAFGAIGVNAYFIDQETSEDNTLTAGTLDLTVDDQDDPNVVHMSVDVNPGDTLHQYWVLKNVGTVCGQPSIEFANIVNYENGCTEPESALDATCGDSGEGLGELGSKLYVLMKWRQGTGPWHEILMVPYGHTKLNNLSGPYGLGENGATPIPVLCENDEVEIELRLWWDGRFSTPADNDAQSDSVEFDVGFILEQDV